ncbi:DUF58 domain-containing protein [Candidatus Babela massiliensis]|uniref:von Willebrand factor type A (VWA) domain containing protein n=1 Tax=Candidatus Babela massiliensis TaxID=673862 RepID=V6DKE7_9BACT|nr:DUF58 domain-containing protein [Candidatus Babela massiliensis]CDK30981.1 von Willebrand factor type A (vWA) domain containing protein [Candidatus Babela massiliensis]
MVKEEIYKFISKIEVKTKKILSGYLSGDYKSRNRGFGFDFNQLREYQNGDDIRYIDWKGSAKSNQLLIRQYLDDKDRSVFLAIDVSGSVFYGSQDKLKFDLIFELSTLLALIFLYSKDSVGLILFTDEIELFIPAKSSRAHIIDVINKLVSFKPKSKGTHIDGVLKFISRMKIKNSLICLISDFLIDFDKNLLRYALKKHDIIAFRCLDERERHLPNLGILDFKDIETGNSFCINTNINKINNNLESWFKTQEDMFKLAKVDFFDAISSENFEYSLINFLSRRVNKNN